MKKLKYIKWQELVHFFKNGGELEFQVSKTDIFENVSEKFWNDFPEYYIQFCHITLEKPGKTEAAASVFPSRTTLNNMKLFKTFQEGGKVYIKKILPESYGIKLVI